MIKTEIFEKTQKKQFNLLINSRQDNVIDGKRCPNVI